MSDLPLDLDLKFLPEWLKEAPAPNRFANFEGEAPSRGDYRGDRPRSPKGRGGPDNRDKRFGKKPGGSPGGGSQDRRPPSNRSGGGQRPERSFENRPPRPVQEPHTPVVKVEISPEPAIAQSIARQIKGSNRACSVFGIAKMFLDKPERHRLKITTLDPNAVIYQIGDGPVSFEKQGLELSAFRAMKDQFYTEETVQGEPPKGNFNNVARDRASGTLLGPSSHHNFQFALRKLYEERYSRRMQFSDFQRQIETVNDPAAVEQWKQQASSKVVFKTRVEEGQEPEIFASAMEAEQHFREHHLPSLLKSGNSLEVSGTNARISADRTIMPSIRAAIEDELAFPAQTVNALRPFLSEAGLHYFKWRKKILYVCSMRPQRHPSKDNFSPSISRILTIIEEQPGINRPELAAAVLGDLAPDSLEAIEKKAALAADLHYLIHIGHVIEFQNGALDLPPEPKQANAPNAPAARQPSPSSEKAKAAPKAPEADLEEAITVRASSEDYQLLPLLVSAGI